MKQVEFIRQMVFIAGLAQIALVTGSLLIPHILKWKVALSTVQPLIKQMFWTYAAYILCINLAFGLVSVFAINELTNGSKLAMLLTAFMAVYWLSRVLIQFFYFDRSSFPTGWLYTTGEVVLVCLFVSLTLIYGLAFYHNYNLL